MRKFFCMLAAVGVFGLLLAADREVKGPFELTVIHTNDNHANHEPQPTGDGGDARQATVIKMIRAEVKNHLTLDAGDRFTGTLFHTQYKGLDNVPFLNGLGFQAMAIGNHEFDEGDAGLAAFADQLACPLVCANIDVSKSAALAGKIKPVHVVTVGGHEIGLIGLSTADTKTGSRPSKDVTFDGDYAAVVQKHVDELTAKGVNKILVLSHIGLSEDLKLAGQVTGVDIIVGGHSHTVLSKTYREAKNTYPIKVNDKDGKPVYIVQAGGGDNRFVGRLDVKFDTDGLVTKATGDTILLSKYIAPDPGIEAEVKALAEPLQKLISTLILDRDGKPARLAVDLPNAGSREAETALGNLVADAMRERAGTPIAIVGGGGLRAGLAAGEVKVGDIYRVLPFTNKLTRFRLKGADLRAALEHGVSRYGVSGGGRFLQVSGLRYTFDPLKPKGDRIVAVEVRSARGEWSALKGDTEYLVASDNYIRFGGDDFTVLRDRAIDPDEDLLPIQDVLTDYLAKNSPVTAALEGRIAKVK